MFCLQFDFLGSVRFDEKTLRHAIVRHAMQDNPNWDHFSAFNEQVYGKFNVLWVTGAIRLQETPGDVAKAPFQMSKKDFDAWPDPVSKKNARNYPADLLPEDEWF